MVESTRDRQIEHAVSPHGLCVMGTVNLPISPAPTAPYDLQNGYLCLLGTDATFWTRFQSAPEASDGQDHPIDRWSRRVLKTVASQLDATVYFPFDGPPYTPFVAWALASGRCFTSPSKILVHDTFGMMFSLRGALHFDSVTTQPINELPARAPCTDCMTTHASDPPCLSSCPARALSAHKRYDLESCHAHLDTPAGVDCLSHGCRARRACPLSSGAKRTPAQSAHHMRYFHNISVTS